MLLCNDQGECDSAAVDSINEGLKAGQLCIYPSVFNSDKLHLDEISSKITNYQENIEKGNFTIVDFLPFYESVKVSNLAPFKQLKERVEELLRKRIAEGKDDKVLIFAEAAGLLSEHCHFDKSIELESWWNDAHSEWLKTSHYRSGYNILSVFCRHTDADHFHAPCILFYFSRHTAFVFASNANPTIYTKMTANPIAGDHPSRICGAPMPCCNISDA